MRKKGQRNQKADFADYLRRNVVSCDLNIFEAKRKLKPDEIRKNLAYYRNLTAKQVRAKDVHYPFLLIKGKKGEKAFLRPKNFQENYPSLLCLIIPPSLSMTERNQWMLIASRVFPSDLFVSDWERLPKKEKVKKPWIDSELPANRKGEKKIIFKTHRKPQGPDPNDTEKRNMAMRAVWTKARPKRERLAIVQNWLNKQIQKGRKGFGGLSEESILRICRAKKV